MSQLHEAHHKIVYDFKELESHYKIFIFDKVFTFVLLLNLTGLFSFVAFHLNVEIKIISLVLLALNCLYVIVNHKAALSMFRKKHIFYWFIFLVFWPFLSTIYAPAINFRELGLQVYYFTLMLATSTYLFKNGFKSLHKIITVAFFITIFGLILSMFMGNLFQITGSMDQLNLRFQGRAFGFYMQPNLAAMSINLLFVVWFAGLRKIGTLTMFLSSLGFFVLVILTGSRAGSIVAFAVVLLIFINKGNRVNKPFKILISPKPIITFFLVLCCFQAFIPLLLVFLKTTLPKRVDNFDVIARIEAISHMKLTEKSSHDTSTVAERLQLLKQYSSEICECPILGKGFGSTTILRAKGILDRRSHNQYLKITFETGIFRLAFYLLLLFSIYIHPRRKRIERLLHTNSYAQFITVVMLEGMVSNTVLDSRLLYCVLGYFIAMLISPQIITDDLALEENSQRPEDTNVLRIQNEKQEALQLLSKSLET